MDNNYLSDNNISVLIADDEEGVRDIIKEYLKQTYENLIIAGEATNGKEALELHKKLKPTIILLDMQMPLCDGKTALQKILLYNPKAKIIVMTCSENLENIINFVKAGYCNYLAKPFYHKELIQVIKETIKGGNKELIYKRLEKKLKEISQ